MLNMGMIFIAVGQIPGFIPKWIVLRGRTISVSKLARNRKFMQYLERYGWGQAGEGGLVQAVEEVEREYAQEKAQKDQKKAQRDQEMAQKGADQYICIICDKVTELQANTSNVICDQCARLHFDTEDL